MTRGNTRKIKLYTLSTCPMCNSLKRRLRAMDMEFETIDVDLLDSGEQWLATKELKRCNPDATYPTMVIEEVVLDFSETNLIDSLADIKPDKENQ
ncbi:MAG TPA: glutaredoxin [Nitrospirae bacterium]|nr:glutaredoxin [Nitrospirota bacterium]